MSVAVFVDALAIPPDARVDQRVPKKLLLEQGGPTAADRRQIQEGIDELLWVAALKPSNIGVPSYRDAVREYLEIAVLTAALRPSAKALRLIELIHRAIPYPVVLLSAHGQTTTVSLASKRFSQGEAGQVVLDGDISSVSLSHARSEPEVAFLRSLAISAQPTTNLVTLYQGWLDRVAALEAARATGTFTILDTAERAAQRREALAEIARLQREVVSLRARAEAETQLSRRATINIELRRLTATLADLSKHL